MCSVWTFFRENSHCNIKKIDLTKYLPLLNFSNVRPYVMCCFDLKYSLQVAVYRGAPL